MTNPAHRPGKVYFGEFELNLETAELRSNGSQSILQGKPFQVLVALLDRPGQLITRDELKKQLWASDTFVDFDIGLNKAVNRLRDALGDSVDHPRFIETLPRKGYRFIGVAENGQSQTSSELRHAAAPSSEPATVEKFSFEWKRRPVLWGGVIGVFLVAILLVARSGQRSTGLVAPDTAVSVDQLHIRKLTENDQATGAAISPDGRYVVFARGEGRDQSLWLRQIDTRTDVQILPADGNAFHGLTFSPDGSLIYFVKSHPGNPFSHSLYSMSMLGGSARMVIADIDGPITFSPDGKQFAYEDCTSAGLLVRIARVDRDDEHQLASIDGACNLFQPGPRWSPDGRTVVVPVYAKTGSWALMTVSTDDGKVRKLYSSEFRIGRPIWLAGGHSLLVPHDEEIFKELQLWTVTFPGGEARRLTDDLSWYDMGLDATPDGRTAVSIVSTRIANIWVASAQDPEHPHQVSEGLPVWMASELANGRILAVDSDGKLWTMDTDGGQRTPFSSLTNVDSFVRCGNVVVALVDTTPTTSTYFRVEMDGSHAVQLASGHLPFPHCSPIAHDLFYVNVTEGRLLRIPIAGGSPTEVGHNLSVGAAWPLGISPDETSLAYVEPPRDPAVADGRRLVVRRTADGSPVGSWRVSPPPNYPHLYRWSQQGLLWQFVKADAGASNVWEQPVTGGKAKQLTRFTSGTIFTFEWSLDAKRLVMTRGSLSHDVVLLTIK